MNYAMNEALIELYKSVFGGEFECGIMTEEFSVMLVNRAARELRETKEALIDLAGEQ